MDRIIIVIRPPVTVDRNFYTGISRPNEIKIKRESTPNPKNRHAPRDNAKREQYLTRIREFTPAERGKFERSSRTATIGIRHQRLEKSETRLKISIES